MFNSAPKIQREPSIKDEKENKKEIYTKVHGEVLPEFLKMYEVSGYASITDHGFNRYKKNKEQDLLIKKEIDNYPNFFIEKIKNAPIEEVSSLIRQGFENSNIEVQKISAEMIGYAPKEERFDLVELGLKHLNIEVQKISIGMIGQIGEHKAIDLLKYCLEIPNIEIQNAFSGEMFLNNRGSLSETEKVSLIKLGLEHKNPRVQKVFFGMAFSLFGEDKVWPIKLGLDHKNLEVKRYAAKLLNLPVPSISQNNKDSLLRLCLKDSDSEVRFIAEEIILTYDQDESLVYKESLIKSVLKNIEKDLEGSDIEKYKSAAKLIYRFRFLRDKKGYLMNLLMEKIKQNLESSNTEIQKSSVEVIDCVPAEERGNLTSLIIEKGLGSELIKSPLYENKDINNKNFSRQVFDKTGSGTTLIGGKLKDVTILRHIKPEAFLVWQKIYENYTIWQKENFNYVPIEPIQAYSLNKNNTVDVFSGVLDLNLKDWEERTEMFKNELEDQKDKILKVLENLDIQHGHTHRRNFCLRFFRDEKGNPDFNKIPRLYLIDFDQAISLSILIDSENIK